MPRTALIAGSSPLLADRLATRLLTAADTDPDGTQVHRCGRGRPAVIPGFPAAGPERLRWHPDTSAATSALADALSDVDLWYLATDTGPARGPALAADLAELRTLLAAVRQRGASCLTLVRPALGPAADERHVQRYQQLEQETVDAATASGTPVRVVRVAPLLAGTALAAPSWEQPGFLRVLAEVHAVVRELAVRAPAASNQPLRWPAVPDGNVPVLDLELAVDTLLGLPRPAGAGAVRYHLMPEPTPLTELVDGIRQVCPVPLAPADASAEPTAADRFLAARLDALPELLGPLVPDPASVDASAAVLGGSAGTAVLPRATAPRQLLAAAWRSLDHAAESTNGGIAPAAGLVWRRIAPFNGSGPLRYLAGGSSGPTLVLLNALGQGVGFWSRLIERLGDSHRVLTWEPRGTDPDEPVLTMAEQVEDLRRVLAAEGVAQAHLVGWCTGPKVALEFARRYPRSVASLVFVAGSFKRLGQDQELDTGYEKHLEHVCRIVQRQPRMASRVGKLLDGGGTSTEPAASPDSAPVAIEEALAAVDPVLQPEVSRPFGRPDVLVRYADQLLDFWSYDALDAAREVRVPALFVGAELDRIASPARLRAAARCVPGARYAEIAGGTHYCLHDRPDLVTALVSDFVADVTQHSSAGGGPAGGGPAGDGPAAELAGSVAPAGPTTETYPGVRWL